MLCTLSFAVFQMLLLHACIDAKTVEVVDRFGAEIVPPATSIPFEKVQKFQATSVLTPSELKLFIEGVNSIKDKNCRNDLNATLNGILKGQHWAMSMYDSSAKSSFGIENGVLHQFGHYDQCLHEHHQTLSTSDENDDDIPVRARYCLANVRLDGLTVQNIGTRHSKPSNYTVAKWGACVPASCGINDLEHYLSTFLQRPVAIDESFCQVGEEKFVISRGMFAYSAILLIFVTLAILSTSYHIYLLYTAKHDEKFSKSATLTMALLSFSVIENSKKLFQASREQFSLNSINGIKALAMLLILAGHAMCFIFGGPVYNPEFINDQVRKPHFAFLTNSLLFVDVFLLLSGFLFCRILLIELERRRGRINVLFLYAGRYLRLTPAYAAVIGFYMTWFVKLGDGPIWRQRIEREQERCISSWWLNILYINNYAYTDKLCMFQSWYLCVDSQMFFLAPIAIYMLNKTRKYGLWFLGFTAIATAVIPFAVTYIQKLDPTLLVYADEMNDLASNAFYLGYYIKTHMRASAYVVGLIIGFLVHVMQEKSIRLPRNFVRLAWLLSIAIGVASMLSLCRFYIAPFNNLEATLYSGFHKVGWNISIAWLVLAATTGHAGWLQGFLSNRIFAPLSRLTYCAYLSNGIVELYHSSAVRAPFYMSYISMTNSAFSHILNTFLLAFCLCLLFESPIHALERILLRKFGSREANKKPSDTKSSNSQTLSTSEEQVA